MLKMNRTLIETMVANSVDIRDIEYLQLIEEYESLKAKKFKVSYIVSLLGEKYQKSERAIYKIIDRMAKQVVQ